ncbi:hypothetical protein [Rhodoferax sp.]|uniref:hypothetical protein n=1 Tax=Rhodoferax sp. TaxID=50421 RepID=UPI0027676604|nr:hypothetical protein [Rhodoferax sp.]
MSEILAYCSDCLILRFSLVERSFRIGGVEISMRELSARLPFARKPVTLADLGGGAPERVFIMGRVELDGPAFDQFAGNLTLGCDWLEKRCYALPLADARACTMVTAPGRPILMVDTQGSNYARYVARLG